ncbi:MAG: hypothetical protein WEC80_00770 [Patescibacteria group bacterium]
MPKKTKKQKIQAQLRKKDFILNQAKKEKNLSKIQLKAKHKKLVLPDTVVNTKQEHSATTYFKKDLVKSLIIVIIIIAIEIVLYFGRINEYF